MSELEGKIKDILTAVKVDIDHRMFFSRVHLFLSKKQKKMCKKKDELIQLLVEEYHDFSFLLDRASIQDSCSFRNNMRACGLAQILILEDGKLNKEQLLRAREVLKDKLYSLGPGRQHDICRQRHILNVLKELLENKDAVRQLLRMGVPYSNAGADKIIRETLDLSSKIRLTNVHVRRAALSAWFSYLRQNVGSCFATAPAIIVQREQPERFLEDIAEMISTGRIKRTFGGVEYSVPMSSSWGVGDLKKPFVVNCETQIGKSPGFIQALQSSGVLNKEASIKKIFPKAQKLILSALGIWENRGISLMVTPEEVFRKVFLKVNDLEEGDLLEFEGQLKDSVFLGMLPVGKKREGKAQAYKRFCLQFDLAKSSFKRLTDNALLKSWEFTLASFAETKAVFSRWNLYSSLGLSPDDEGGVGSCLFEQLKERLEKANDLVHEMNLEYERYYERVKYQESRMSQATTDEELRSLKVAYQNLVSEMNFFLEKREAAHYLANRWANLYNFLIEQYDQRFKEYFQEVYDAEMHDITTGPYDDSPAGFRLVYKHGRSDTSQWSQVKNEVQFIDFLADFFISSEREIILLPEMKGLEKDFSEITTGIVNLVRRKEFLESAFYRMARDHGGKFVENPLDNLDKIDKKPWVYTSGGTMNYLVSCYYSREELPKMESRWVENVSELFAFFLDVMKGMPDRITKGFLDDSEKSMLMHSPTHAFVFKPGKSPFKEGWLDKGYTYTWIRDNIVIPGQHFIKNMSLSQLMMQELIEEMSMNLLEPYRHNFKKAFNHLSGVKEPMEFRQEIISTMNMDRALQLSGRLVFEEEDIDSMLYSMLPMHLGHEISPVISQVISTLPGLLEDEKKEVMEIYAGLSHRLNRFKVVSSSRLKNILRSLILLLKQTPSMGENFHSHIVFALQKLGFSMPKPVIFADTNWARDYFAFVVNPGTGELDFWRVDALGSEGTSMATWKKWLDGSHKKPLWGVYFQPSEYGG